MPVLGQRGQNGADDRIGHGFGFVVGQDGGGAVGAHAAGIGALVAVIGGLVVLGGRQGNGGLAVAQAEEGGFLAHEELLDDELGTGGTVRTLAHDVVHGIQGFLGGLGHHHALAGSQAVGLDHDGSADLAHVGRARLLVGEAAVGGGWHAGALHDLLSKLLGALHLGGLAVGAKRRDARGAHRVGDARNQRGLWANDHKANAMPRSPGGNALGRLRVKVCHLGGGVHAAVAGSDPHLAGAWGLRQLGQKRVLAPTGTQKKNVDLAVAH